MRKAAFFDRDGVINIDYGFVGKIENFDIIKDVPESLKKLRDSGYLLVLVTNQSGIARGKYTEADFFKVTSFMQQNLALYDASFDEVYFCPHHPEAPLERYRRVCECRKPKSGMFFKAATDLDIDLSSSVMFGDHASDLEAASGAGIKKLYLTGEHLQSEGPKCPDARAFHLLSEAVNDLHCRI